MKQTRWTILFVGLCLVFGFACQANAQGLPYHVAVVDVAQLIKEHPEFAAKQKNLQGIVQAEEARFRARQQTIVEKEKSLANGPHKAGTKAHQDLMEEIANDYADFDKDAKAMQRKFALENSKIMYDTYQDIKRVIGQFAQTRKIAQVTDYRMFEANPLEPQTVAEDMDQKLVWFDPQLNVTEYVIEEMYRLRGMQRPAKTNTEVAQPGAQPAAAGAPVASPMPPQGAPR